MDKEREQEIVNRLAEHRHSEPVLLLVELLRAKRETYRDQLERVESDITRGKAQECKKIIDLFC